MSHQYHNKAFISSPMGQASRLLSLSGLGGVFIGLFALIAGNMVSFLIDLEREQHEGPLSLTFGSLLVQRVMTIALAVLICALFANVFLTLRKTFKQQLPFWTQTTKILLIQMAIPLAVGGILCFACTLIAAFGWLVPLMLIFYGLSLVLAWRFTQNELIYLALLEILLGGLCFFFQELGIWFWLTGFSFAHILYGILMSFKYP